MGHAHWPPHGLRCELQLGWICEFATADSQRYKEDRAIVERAVVQESEGFEENVLSDNS